ncbi:MAG: deoxyribonuclease IV [Firmicutes bacterium]|nr:deoxyribonuclease IV [Bacillota bacterium]
MLFENQSGAGGEIAGKFEAIQELIAGVNEPDRVGVCFDTCHAFAAGYDLSNREGWEETLSIVEKTVGLSSIKIFHLNDSMGPLGSHLDRHQHIGIGTIGLDGFDYLVNHEKLNQLPGILETPQKTAEDDLKNLATLRQLFKEKT